MLWRASLRALLVWCVLSGAGFLFVRAICGALTPIIETGVNALQSDYTARVSVIDSHDMPRIAMSCTVNREIAFPNGRRVPFLGTYTCATTDAIHALVPMLIFLVLVIGWPVRGGREFWRRACWSIALLPLIIGLTTPILLAGLVAANWHPETFSADAPVRALWQPFVFLEMGGQWLLPLIAAMLCLRLSSIKQ